MKKGEVSLSFFHCLLLADVYLGLGKESGFSCKNDALAVDTAVQHTASAGRLIRREAVFFKSLSPVRHDVAVT